jgi:inhibitor of KinA
MQITPLGDNALMLHLGQTVDARTHQKVLETWRTLAAAPMAGVTEVVPAYTSVTVFYDPAAVVQAGASLGQIIPWLGERVRERLKNPPKMEKVKPRTIEIPVCYGGDFGPDLGLVAKQAKLSPEEVIKRHAKAEYLVYVIGFAPGFPYLGGLPKELATPRLAKPRVRVPAGAVGIGGAQTAIYPLVTPGGWNLIGRTPTKLFLPKEDPPVLLRPGDRVKFRAISADEFSKLEAAK